MTSDTVDFVVNVGSQTFGTIMFNVTERLETDVIFGFGFCDVHIEAIHLELRIVQLKDDTAVPIIKGPFTRSSNLAPIWSDQ